MRTKSTSYWMNQIVSAEGKNSNAKEPHTDSDLNYHVAQYYVSKNNSKSKVA
jgi:hypothetical protein